MSASPPESFALRDATLRRAIEADAKPVAAAVTANLSHLAEWLSWATPEAATVEAQRERLRESQSKWAAGSDYAFVVTAGSPEAIIGGFGLHRRLGPGAIEMGYWLAEVAVGKGYATAAADALTKAALALPDVHRVEIHCDTANLRSNRVPERLGYRVDRVIDVDAIAPKETGQRTVWVFHA